MTDGVTTVCKYGIKVIDIAFTTNIVFFLAFSASFGIHCVVAQPKSTHIKNIHTVELVARLVATISLLSIAVWMVRNVTQRVPFPLDGVCGYRHAMLKELGGGAIVAFAVMACLPSLFKYKKELFERVDTKFRSDCYESIDPHPL